MADVITRLKLESGEYDSKIQRATKGLLQMERECRRVNGTLATLEKEQKEYVQSLGQMQTVATNTRGKISELTNAYTELRLQYNRLTDAEKKGDFGKALNSSLAQLKTRIDTAKADLASVQRELTSSKTATIDMNSVLSNLGSRLGVSSELMSTLTSGTIAYTAAIGSAATAVVAAAKAWMDYNSVIAKQQQITTVTTGLKGDDADRMTSAARALSRTYSIDFREAINGANTLMTQFGVTGDEAINLIRQGMQGMIQGDGPKLLSMIQQYAPSFRDAGISASQLVAIIQNSEGGIFTDQNMNAIVMGIKNIRLMTNATSDALAKLGIDGKEMSKELNNGTITIFEALKKVAEAVQGVDSNSQAAGEVMQTVFGRQGAMAGTKLGEAIATLNTNLDETKRQTGEVGKAYDQLYQANQRLEQQLQRTFEYKGWDEMATSIKTSLVSAMANLLEVAGDVKSVFDDVRKADVSEGVSKSTPRAIQELQRLAELAEVLWQRIRGEGGGGKGIGYGDLDKAANSVKAGKTKEERQQRYDRQHNYMKRWASETTTTTVKNGTMTERLLTPEQIEARQRRLQRWESMRDQLVTAPEPVKKTKPAATSSTSGSSGKGGKQEIDFADDSIMAQEKLVADLTQKWKTASAAVKDDYAKQLDAAKKKLVEMQESDVDKFISQFDVSTQSGESDSPVKSFIDKIKTDIAQANIDKDMQQLSEIMTMALKGGMESADLESISADIMRRILNGDNIPQDVFDELKEYIEENFPDIKLKVGGEKEEGKKGNGDSTLKEFNEKSNKFVSGLSSVSSGLQGLGVEIPTGVQKMITAMQSVLSIIQGVQAVISIFQVSAITANTAALTANTAVMLATGFLPFANGGIVPKFANGGLIGNATGGMLIPGNSLSGDNLHMPVIGSKGMIGVNSGELILNKSQQDSLADSIRAAESLMSMIGTEGGYLNSSQQNAIAQELEGGGIGNMQLDTVITGEEIRLVLNDNGRRTGRGEFVQTRKRG